MIPLKWLLLSSGALAAFALLVPMSLFLTSQFSLYDGVQRWAAACAWGSVGLLVLGFFMHRWKAIWLIIPVLLSFAFPVYVALSLGLGIDECVQQHRQLQRSTDTCFP